MTGVKGEYRLAPKAVDDMEDIWLYSFKQWGTEQAESYIDSMVEAFTALAENPKLGMNCSHIRENYRRNQVKRHVIFYRMTSYGIEVMSVLHDRMLPLQHL